MTESGAVAPVSGRRRVLFLFSDTGGGHRSATEAMIEALELEFPGVFETAKVDFFRQYYPRPLKFAPEIYPPLTKVPRAWGLSYKLSNGRRRTRAVNQLVYPYVRRGCRNLLRENPADVIVSVHWAVNHGILQVMREDPHPYMTVVTDLVSTHAFWFDRRADAIVVPTEEARQNGIEEHIPPSKLQVVGLPVAERFRTPSGTKAEIRARLGWEPELPVILLVGGGDGMGPIARVAREIDAAGLKAQLVVICGRNEELKARLEAHRWRIPVKIYGFVREMPDFMNAADMLVTKAGPGTICEAFIAGLPLILYARVPGQEDGNVSYVVEHQAGVWAPTADEVLGAVESWVRDPAARAKAAEASRRLANPDAARNIARLIAARVGVTAGR